MLRASGFGLRASGFGLRAPGSGQASLFPHQPQGAPSGLQAALHPQPDMLHLKPLRLQLLEPDRQQLPCLGRHRIARHDQAPLAILHHAKGDVRAQHGWNQRRDAAPAVLRVTQPLHQGAQHRGFLCGLFQADGLMSALHGAIIGAHGAGRLLFTFAHRCNRLRRGIAASVTKPDSRMIDCRFLVDAVQHRAVEIVRTAPIC